ncbi:3'-5' exonuclease [Streptomyces sp. NBC_01462]|uniref:3'-5' exonuclease n=1 Tax=Streptomyces sp. NBC_01462 TaxID=2903876 RepID=UPI002E35C3F6|nr:3'-5' exonuclease [Streptomyces sp. NBC_01462]
MTIADPDQWEDLFTRTVDEHPVQFVRPADTDRPTWATYEGGRYLGTLSGKLDGGRPRWRVQATRETHHDLDDAVRALRRPATWPRERARVSRWARGLPAGDGLLAVDVETTGLQDAFAVQIAAVDRRGGVVFNEYVQPNAVIEQAAVAVHGIAPERVASAATFGELLPRLTDMLHGRTLVSYNAAFDRGVFERELARHHGAPAAAEQWLARVRWEDAMVPYAVCSRWTRACQSSVSVARSATTVVVPGGRCCSWLTSQCQGSAVVPDGARRGAGQSKVEAVLAVVGGQLPGDVDE